jgi:hypothetical protein
MSITRDEAAALALTTANRIWDFPRADEELVILNEWVEESDLAWAFTYNTKTFAHTNDITRALGVGNGAIIVVKATGEVRPMPASYSCKEALKVFEVEFRN